MAKTVGKKTNVKAVASKRPAGSSRQLHRVGRSPDLGDNKHKHMVGDPIGVVDGNERHQRDADEDQGVGRDAGGEVLSDEPHHDVNGSGEGADRLARDQAEIAAHPKANYSVERLDELLIHVEPKWHLRQVMDVLVTENWGEGAFPNHKDISRVGDILRLGSAGLSIRFREVDPSIWQWLIEELEARQ